MKQAKIGLGIVAAALSFNSYAGAWTDVKTITYIGTGASNEGVYFIINDSALRYNGCGPNIVILNKSTNTLLNQNISIVLSAFYNKYNVKFYVVGCVDAQNIEATAIAVQN
jgi:hypothetical protein